MRIIPTYVVAKRVRHSHNSWKNFTEQPWAAGGILLLCVIIAMLLANLPVTKDVYRHFLETNLSATVQSPLQADGTRVIDWTFPKDMNVEKFINDFLMVIFFFAVGLEIKRELVSGELSSPKKAMLPVIAAAGGMATPALLFILFNHGTSASSGWGIPTATDIAFAVGIMSILGNKVPISLKIFLTALAIADDLGAILVVALFYGGNVNLPLLCVALLLLAFLILLNQLGENRMICYLVPAVIMWFIFYYSGVHSTMSGVVMAMTIPMKPRYSPAYLTRRTKEYKQRLLMYRTEEEFPNENQRHCLRRMSFINMNAMGMSSRLEHALYPYVNYLIMPIFALANAGVEIPDLSYFNIFQYSPEIGSVGMGVFFGLVLGKPIGITLASFIAIKCRIGVMPALASWKMLFAVACLGGIGFTMSIFVDTLSFGDCTEYAEHLRSCGKIAVLLGSLTSGILGSVLIRLFSAKTKQTD